MTETLILQRQIVRVYFDGGCGVRSYGSYEIQSASLSHRGHRLDFGPPSTSNIAEYQSLLAALKWLGHNSKPAECNLEIWGDSKLVVNQVSERWKCRVAHLIELRDEARQRLAQFAGWRINWHRRSNSVRIFGH